MTNLKMKNKTDKTSFASEICGKAMLCDHISVALSRCRAVALIVLLSPLLYILPPTPSFAADFTFIQPGARANAMGGAFSAIANDSYAIFYNPAGISTLNEKQISGEISRRLDPLSPIGEISAVYIRPQPDRINNVAALGFHSLRHSSKEKKDSLIAGYSGIETIKHFQKPIRWGGNLKIMRLSSEGKNNIGIGFDAGAMLESDVGLKTALTLYDLNLGVGKNMTTVTLGNSYHYKDTVFAIDFKIRSGHSEFFTGMEHTVMNGLLQLRAGKGLALSGTDYLAYGLGINTLPFIIDIAASIPWEGMHKEGGHYSIGVTYKFGKESFSEKLVGNASNKLNSIQAQIASLRAQRTNLQTSIASYQINKSLLKSDLIMMQSKQEELEKTLRNLNIDIDNAQYNKSEPKPVKRRKIKRVEKWPKRYKIKQGDTLRSITSRFYGNPSLWETIYNANGKNILRGLPINGRTFTIPPPPRKK